MAATRRWLRVEVLLAEWLVLLMIDMALPFGVSAGEERRKTPREERAGFATAPAHRGFVMCVLRAGLRACEGQGCVMPCRQVSPSHALAQWI